MEQMNYKLYFGEDSPILHQSIRVVPPNTTKQHAQAQAPHHETCTEEVNVCGSLAETGFSRAAVVEGLVLNIDSSRVSATENSRRLTKSCRPPRT